MTLYAQFAVYYAKQAVAGAKYRAGMKTDHGSKIVKLLGNLEDAIVAPGRVEGERQRPGALGELTSASELVDWRRRAGGRSSPAARRRRPKAIWKSFGRTQALQDVSRLGRSGGECHALVGRNGAGSRPSSACSPGCSSPIAAPSRLHGEPAPSLGDRAAWQERVACVYQRSMVDPDPERRREHLPEPHRRRRSSTGASLRRQARELLLEWGFDLDVDQPAGELSVEQKQIVEIARALSIGRAS